MNKVDIETYCAFVTDHIVLVLSFFVRQLNVAAGEELERSLGITEGDGVLAVVGDGLWDVGGQEAEEGKLGGIGDVVLDLNFRVKKERQKKNKDKLVMNKYQKDFYQI